MDAPEARHAWNALALCASEPNPFHESWYLLPALRALDPQGRVKLLRIEVDGELAGLIPLRPERKYYKWPIPQLGNWVHGNCFLGAPLVAAGLERHFWAALLNWADRNAGKALFLHLGVMPLDGPLYRALQSVLADQGRLAGLVHREERAMLASSQTPQAYFEENLSGKKRKELRRQSARLAELGEVKFERRRDDHRLARWAEDFLSLEHSGWKGTAGSALASHQATARLFKEALSGAAALGKLERLTLTLNDEPIAMLVNFLTAPGAYSYKTAFDERYARYSPGVLVQRENLDLLEHAEVRWCDSCASADHPMIDHIWRERRPVGRLSIAIGGKLRRAVFARLLRTELGRNPAGI
jgi:CelD/BcsL family acetyltransferase involved in cellulose biosynthesis